MSDATISQSHPLPPHLNCPHAKNNICKISTSMANMRVPLDIKACSVCSQHHPNYDNRVTTSRALYILRKNNKDFSHLQAKLTRTAKSQGPGTELSKLISWFIRGSCGKCKQRAKTMDLWGPDKCLENIDTIKMWLRESAGLNRLPYSDKLVTILINRAIENSRK